MSNFQDPYDRANNTTDTNELRNLWMASQSDPKLVGAILDNENCALELKKDIIEYFLIGPGLILDFQRGTEADQKMKVIRRAVDDYIKETAKHLGEITTRAASQKVKVKRALSLPDIADDDSVWLETRPSLERGQPVILKGPPGTSKTYVARGLAKKIVKGATDRVHIIQFHPSWGYEDFIEAQRVLMTNDGQRIQVEDKVFKSLCNEAQANLEQWISELTKQGRSPAQAQIEALEFADRYVLIIDEFSRADVSRVFGEVLSSLDYREDSAELLYSGDNLFIPRNLVIIATMNDWDRSVTDLDYAMLRRFEEYRLEPSETGLKAIIEATKKAGPLEDELEDRLLLCFREIQKRYPPHGVGHVFFLGVRTWDDLKKAWLGKVKPTLYRLEGYVPGLDPGQEEPDKIRELEVYFKERVLPA